MTDILNAHRVNGTAQENHESPGESLIYHAVTGTTPDGRPRAMCGYQFHVPATRAVTVRSRSAVATAKRPGVACPDCAAMARLNREFASVTGGEGN